MRSLQINQILFIDAFERDIDFEDIYPYANFLDTETGEVVWLFEEDEDAQNIAGIKQEENDAVRKRIEASPGKYLEIPGLSHSEHHDILREFLYSDWTDDSELMTKAQQAYSGSIGRWKKAIDRRDAEHAYYEFRERKIMEMADEFLHEHHIDPLWM